MADEGRTGAAGRVALTIEEGTAGPQGARLNCDSRRGAHRHSRLGCIVMADKGCTGAAGRVISTVDVEVALICGMEVSDNQLMQRAYRWGTDMYHWLQDGSHHQEQNMLW